uniref:Calcium-binding protein n=1 Tax=virus sp. ctrcb4 TaxID=2825824 RepID=A0A8S5RQ14_9VIRU|nr:MAG TPA: calcium-binding protein [virus sp. ctrcb4]DAR12676.1 MAG TPA: calcium-binding protein [Crassvirales sp.]
MKILQVKRDYEHEKNLNIFDYLLIGRVHINNI